MKFNIRLILAQHVKVFIRSQKSDANDALAICETACLPDIHFVPLKILSNWVSKHCEISVSSWLSKELRWQTSFVLGALYMGLLFL